MSLDSSSTSVYRGVMTTVGMVQARWARTKSLGVPRIWLAFSSGAELWIWVTVQTQD